MSDKENYEKYKEAHKRASRKYYQSHKRASRKYYQSHKEEFRLYRKSYYKKNKEKLYKKNREYKAKDAKWKEYESECSRLCNSFLYPEQIPELEDYVCVSDLNYKIEKGGFIYGSKC